MPPLMHLTAIKDILLWWEGYLKTYLGRDIRELTQIESLIDFKRVLDSLAIRTGNILNQAEIARDTGVSQPTVYRYIKLLEVSNIIKRIPAYYRNRTKRITKSPKLYLWGINLTQVTTTCSMLVRDKQMKTYSWDRLSAYAFNEFDRFFADETSCRACTCVKFIARFCK
jgi:DNA-binding Lrp family transcriptional regulator